MLLALLYSLFRLLLELLSSAAAPRPASSPRDSFSAISFASSSAKPAARAGNLAIACCWPRSAAGCRDQTGPPSWSARRPSCVGTVSWSVASDPWPFAGPPAGNENGARSCDVGPNWRHAA